MSQPDAGNGPRWGLEHKQPWPPLWSQERIENYEALVWSNLVLGEAAVERWLIEEPGRERLRSRLKAEFGTKRELLRLHAPRPDGSCGLCPDPGTHAYPALSRPSGEIRWVKGRHRRAPWPCPTFDAVARPLLIGGVGGDRAL